VDENSEPGARLEEEPQEERGAPGSRDTGADGPGGGPVDRPAGTADADDDTAVDPQGSTDPEAPHLPTGDSGG
jgi:hypothetical protein